MKTATSAMLAITGPNGPRQLYRADLFEITLLDGTVLRYTTWDKPLVVSGITYLSGPPIIQASKVKQTIGTSVDTSKLTIKAAITDLVEGIPWLHAISGGLFIGATFKQSIALMAVAGDTTPGAVIWFVGSLGPVDQVGRSSAQITVTSGLNILQNVIPRRVLQAGCPWTLFDAGCALTRASFKVSSTAQAGSTQNKIITTLVNPDAYFTLGVLEIKSGANAGLKRNVRVHASGILYLSVKLPNAINTGDAFDVYPGCDKKYSTCNVKFSNLANYGGEDFVPVPETAI